MPIFHVLQLTIFFLIFVATSTIRSLDQNILEPTDLAPQQHIPESLDCTTEESVLQAVLVKLGVKTQHLPSITWDGCQVTKIILRDKDLAGSLSSDIEKLQKLKVLDLKHTQVSGVLASLQGATELQGLLLSGTKVSGDLLSLKGATKLQSLSLRGTDVSGNLFSLKEATKLRRLWLDGTTVSGDLASLKEATDLHRLTLSGTNVKGDLSSLKGAAKMQRLWLDGTTVTGELSSLKDATELQKLVLSGTTVSGDLSSLKEARKLQKIDLLRTFVTGDFSVLLQWPEVEEVDFSRTNIYGTLSEEWRGKAKKLLRLRVADAGPQFAPLKSCALCTVSVPDGPRCEGICITYTISQHVFYAIGPIVSICIVNLMI